MYNLAKEMLDYLIGKINSKLEIATQIKGVFYNIPLNQLYPFIHICNITLKNYGVKNDTAIEVTFDLTIYCKANDFARLNQISDDLANLLTQEKNIIVQNSKITLSSKTNIYENKINMKFII